MKTGSNVLSEPSVAEYAKVEELFFDFFKPKPTPFNLVRIGGAHDGAYLLPDDFEGIGACFSPGVADFKSFEDQLAHSYGIRSYMVDFSTTPDQLRTPLMPGLQSLEKLWLTDRTGRDSITLTDWIERWEPGGRDFLLQMDIEGGEYPVMASTSVSVLSRFRAVAIELHNVRTQLLELGLDSPVIDLAKKFDQVFTVAHVHPINSSKLQPLPGGKVRIPEVFEVTLINRERLSQFEDANNLVEPSVPHPLDIASTFPHNPPVFFDAKWRSTDKAFQAWRIFIFRWGEFLVHFSVDYLVRRTRKRLRKWAYARVNPIYLFLRKVRGQYAERKEGSVGSK